MNSIDLNNVHKSKLKTYNILSKIFFIVFISINFLNFIPFKINDPQWGSGISLLYIDTFSIVILGVWLLKNSILEMEQLCTNTNLDKKEQADYFISITRRKTRLNEIVKILIISLIVICFFQIYVFIKGLNVIDYKLKFNLESIKYQSENELVEKEAIKDTKEDSISINSKLDPVIQQATKATFLSASTARFELIKSRIRVFLISIIYSFGLKLLEKA